MTIPDEPIDATTWQIDKDDPIWIWLETYCRENNLSYQNLDMIKMLEAMPMEMAKEFLRRMITSQAVPNLSSQELKAISKLAFTIRRQK